MAKIRKKIVGFKSDNGTKWLLILTIVVIAIFIFVQIFNYITSDKVTYYEVTYGSNAESSSTSFKGVAIRKEKIIYSNQSGYIEYFVKEASRISKNTYLYGVDSSRKFSQTLDDIKKEKVELEDENISSLTDLLYEFSDDYDDKSFYDVYDFKSNLNSTVTNFISTNAINKIAKKTAEAKAPKKSKFAQRLEEAYKMQQQQQKRK